MLVIQLNRARLIAPEPDSVAENIKFEQGLESQMSFSALFDKTTIDSSLWATHLTSPFDAKLTQKSGRSNASTSLR